MRAPERAAGGRLVLMAGLAALGKGRSSSRRMLQLYRQAAAYTLGYGLKIVSRWVPSLRNWADGVSRGRGLGYLDLRTGLVRGPPGSA